MTTEEKQASILQMWYSHRDTIKLLQEHYKEHSGRLGYFQGMPSHDILPDGETKSPVNMEVFPGDQIHNYADFLQGVRKVYNEETEEMEEVYDFPPEALFPFTELSACVRFDVLAHPGNKYSWQITLEYDDGDHWSYTEDSDGNVVEDWHIVGNPEI